MKTFSILFGFNGKKYKAEVEANTKDKAIERLKNKIQVISVEEVKVVNYGLEYLKSLIGIK